MRPGRAGDTGSEPRYYSLASRVGLELVVLTVVLNLMLGAFVTWFWMKKMRGDLDGQLLQIARQASTQLKPDAAGGTPGDATMSDVGALAAEHLMVVVRDRAGAVVQTIPPNAPQIPFQAPAGADAEYVTLPAGALAGVLSGGPMRFVTLQARGDSVVQVGISQSRLDNLERILRVVFLGLIPPLTAGASLLAWLVVGRRLSRLRQLSSLAQEIAPGRLDKRLDETGARDEIGRLAREVNRMLARLEAGFQAEDRFISEVSHELKTPVSVMLIEAQVLMRSTPDSVTYAKFVASVEDEMRRLNKLIESFLTLARAGHGDTQIRRTSVDMNSTTMEAAQHCWQLAKLRAVRLAVTLVSDDHCPDTPEVIGDPELLRTMVENLLRNALSVSPRQSAVDLRVTCEDGHVIVCVRDRGPGVPDTLAPRIFDRFVTADPSGGHARKGEGLGLTIARGIAKLHGGSINFRNLPPNDGGGAEFFASVPMHQNNGKPRP